MDSVRLRFPQLESTDGVAIKQRCARTFQHVYFSQMSCIIIELKLENPSAFDAVSPHLEWVVRYRCCEEQVLAQRVIDVNRLWRRGGGCGNNPCKDQNQQAGAHRSNETKMSDGGRERASLGVKVWKSSQNWSVQRSAVRSIAWLDGLTSPSGQA